MTAHTIKIGIPGAAGRMGRMLIREIDAAPDLELVAASEHAGTDAIGQDSGLLAATGSNGIIIGDDPAALASADVIIDFTSPAASVAHAGIASSSNTALVVGTTGLTDEDEASLRAAAAGIALVYCANTSVGGTLLGKLVEQVAAQLVDGWDIEILEAHPHHKVDPPSGTALALGEGLARGRGVNLEDVKQAVRDGHTGERKAGDIWFATLRGGDVAGEHEVIFAAEGERVLLGHKASSRQVFAAGAIRAALWTKGQSPGLYNMRHVLGFED